MSWFLLLVSSKFEIKYYFLKIKYTAKTKKQKRHVSREKPAIKSITTPWVSPALQRSSFDNFPQCLCLIPAAESLEAASAMSLWSSTPSNLRLQNSTVPSLAKNKTERSANHVNKNQPKKSTKSQKRKKKKKQKQRPSALILMAASFLFAASSALSRSTTRLS